MGFTNRRSARERGAGIAGVALVHIALAALVVTGLSTEITRAIFSGPIKARNIEDPVPPPPPPDPQPETTATLRPVVVPPVPNPLPQPNFIETTTTLPPLGDDIIPGPLPPIGDLGPATRPLADPIAATPRNNPLKWISDSDYKSRWIREGLSGTAGFRLEIGADGKVADCRITRSTGHAELDRATCALIAGRAKFDPARDTNGAAVTGSYSSAVRWQLPE